jgi:addiction module HigA family antidote
MMNFCAVKPAIITEGDAGAGAWRPGWDAIAPAVTKAASGSAACSFAGNHRRRTREFPAGRQARRTWSTMNERKGMPIKTPPHPGDLIRTEIIEALGLSVTQAADMLGVRQAALSDLLNEQAGLSPELALRIEKTFGPKLEHLLYIQLAYDIAQVRSHDRGSSATH